MLRKLIVPTWVVAAGIAGAAQAQEALEVGANIGNVPWEFQDDTGAFVGFEVDLASAVAAQLGRL